MRACGLVQRSRSEAVVRVQRQGELGGSCAHLQDVSRAVTEGDAQAYSEQDGKEEDPENGFWLAQEETEARHCELVEGAGLKTTHRADSSRSGRQRHLRV